MMLTGIKMAFIGGDARIIEVVRYVSDLDASTYLFGFDRLSLSFPDMQKVDLHSTSLADFDVIVLPIAGMDDEGRVDAAFSDAPLRLTDEHFASISKNAPIFSGIARPALQAMVRKHGLQLIRLMELDEVAILNSVPTAEGAIAMAMERTEITLHGATCVVMGLGRCGYTLGRMLSGIGANVRVFARKPADLARIAEMGLHPYDHDHLIEAITDADVIFNTIPAPILTADVLTHVPRSCVIVDIASAPGGTDFRFAEKRGINAILAPSLPGIVAPKTAGRIIAQTIVRMIQPPVNTPGGI
ncbi:Dipicolinate synthase subunit A [Acidibacillus sp. S0AB]|uniref:Dipicolinate synthase subunit A n=2 Tax=Sulfoacidibacillus ferrooxidans TaxID=2005001 RepID=A0A9X1VCP5_9BACL|nr:Dipicolinate synthase subunit A [Sulfoacidibacillus ferrooxidans]